MNEQWVIDLIEREVLEIPISKDNYYSSAFTEDRSVLIIGHPADTRGQGIVYVFMYNDNTWNLEAKLEASFRINDSFFGQSVSISDDGKHIAVGTLHVEHKKYNNTGVYVFVKLLNGWFEETQIINQLNTNASFGYSVALNSEGNKLVIGSPNLSDNCKDVKGVAYIYNRLQNEWFKEAKLKPKINSCCKMGSEVFIKDSEVVIGDGKYMFTIFDKVNKSWTEGIIN